MKINLSAAFYISTLLLASAASSSVWFLMLYFLLVAVRCLWRVDLLLRTCFLSKFESGDGGILEEGGSCCFSRSFLLF